MKMMSTMRIATVSKGTIRFAVGFTQLTRFTALQLRPTWSSGAMWPSVFVSITGAADGRKDPGESHLEVEECEISISQVQTWTLGTPRY